MIKDTYVTCMEGMYDYLTELTKYHLFIAKQQRSQYRSLGHSPGNGTSFQNDMLNETKKALFVG